MSNDSLGDRMKQYEDCYRIKLPRRVPKVLRIDGRAFHTFLKGAGKPYDRTVMHAMQMAAQKVMEDIGGVARFAYIQSDECSIAINDHLDQDTQPWFDNNIQKMVSVAASVFTNWFNIAYKLDVLPCAAFDARVFLMPDENELVNYFIWRQQDASRNSIQQYGRHYFSHNELDGKSNPEVQEMMFQQHQFNWDGAPCWTKRGIIVCKAIDADADYNIPLFTADREYITKFYEPTPEQA